ncbi:MULTISPECIES: TIGR03087 family PEP-CTERM/XrtA system glycosyltransferase [unclassified Sphingomonas]|uniref:TIGR03087 family PEP-CTERM/XrtA system glycosyltransferase n=1 Tax=unclassified Sphingomonas TaxID=196159 RepID=UPI0006F4CAC4|nr:MULTISPECIES: TIGR03087 family PEP-CTERM/XrtA system glycosyltransferase [unclassified Sphingomonas]KQM66909.1 glycosyl transferase family 1 [Sphingomonas sp. Leaf16]KQN17856.1 glycosyl transferase family 1 [Sphingomonas sp. Leaf29]KQN23719.1 glycosyl transferase family 1 [Sphingomonas sp. Leaf32]
MSDILFLAHRVSYPPDRGDKVRSHHVMRHLSTLGRVHLATFADDPRDMGHEGALGQWCASVQVLPRTKGNARAAVEALASGRTVSEAAFDSAAMRATVAELLAERRYDAVYVYSGQMAQYVPADLPFVMDFVDMDSAKFAAYAEDARGPMRWVMRREATKLAAFEAVVAGRARASLLVSEAEADLFRRMSGAGRVHAIENGIDTAFFDPAGVVPVEQAGPLIVFTGQMDYRPNVEAVRWFVSEVLPLIPDARFAIVGRSPTPAVRALESERVIVTGEVADVRGWIAAAAVVVAPLLLARGIQNKVLEAMAMARPVVASVAAAEGIDHNGTIGIAGDAAGFAKEIREVLADPAAASALGQAARARTIERYGWDARLAPLAGLLGLA